MTYAYLAQPSKFNCKQEDVDFTKMVWGSGYGYGDAYDSNSYRAELFGIYAAVKFTNTLCNKVGTEWILYNILR
jgi:hypothetical protein